MQSNGGLNGATRFQGKDAILSGPAGGIVGAAQVSKLAGFDKIIGFDMGGTSTDVTHYAGEYEREFATEVAGVRIRAPMMKIHTVAAGGGSICSFDGARFRVGPQSAGANPGPASYRRDRKSTPLNSSHTWISYALLFFNDTATTEIYTLSLHDALPISLRRRIRTRVCD